MGNRLREFEDALLGGYINATEPLIKEIDRSAEDIIAETNRFKSEKRKTKKHAKEVLSATQMMDADNQPLVIDWSGEKVLNYRVDSEACLMSLKRKLETSVSFLEDEGLGVWEIIHIKWQACAQVLWYDQPKAKLEQIKKELLDVKFFDLLEFNRECFTSLDNLASRYRNLEDVIRLVSPREGKKGRPAKDEVVSKKVVPIPSVYDPATKKIHSQALYIAIGIMAKVLSFQKKSYEEIINHPVVMFYKELCPSVLQVFIGFWIQEALDS